LSELDLKLADDHSEKTRRKKSWTEWPGPVLTNRRKLSQGDSDRGRGGAELPADFFLDCARLFWHSQARCFGGIGGRAQRVRAHVWNGSGLARCARGSRGCKGSDLTRGAPGNESVSYSLGHAKLTTGEGAGSRDRVAGAAIARSFRLKQAQHPLRAVRSPRCDDPPVGFAQRLCRLHGVIIAGARERPRTSNRHGARPWCALGDSVWLCPRFRAVMHIASC
jgi:hypothetical protein